MKVKELYALLGKALEERPEITNMTINVDADLDDTMKLGIYAKSNQVLILSKVSYFESIGMEVYSYEL